MKQEHTGGKQPFDPADYPSLREFFPAYLHEDFVGEYGSSVKAAEGFLSDASGDEILQVKEEWKHFREQFRGKPFEEIQEAIRKLGSAWRPEGEKELNDWDDAFGRAHA
ncbi:MAG TPA: hypothetical protein VMH20_10810 [Verrucomicrobiae bacterium]|nr:hypothetical protein [Verrucomicrobiae bacterium]